jgi:NADH-quinone oxidoreductase subunit C
MSRNVLDLLRATFGPAILETHSALGDDTAVVDPAHWRDIGEFLRSDSRTAMNMFVDLTAVDWLGRREPRFEVVLHLRSLEHLHRIRLKARVGDAGGKTVRIASLVSIWPGANWFEREAYDMFGVEFVGHPDLRRILLYEEFKGHPLRKDYPAERPQPLVAYREGIPGKLPPFGPSEGMPFGRQSHTHRPAELDDGYRSADEREEP